MEIGPTPRIPLLPSSAEPPRASAPPPEAVRTLLPADNAVQQTDGIEKTGAPERAPLPSDHIGREVTVDLDTQKIVFQTIDERTGDVVSQFPDPRYLKAYRDQVRASAEAERGSSQLAQTLA